MDKAMNNVERALSDLFPNTGKHSLPIPRFGKTPPSAQQAQALPTGDSPTESFSLSWIDDEDLGIRAFITSVPGPKGREIWASVQGIRPDLLGQAVSVALSSAAARGFKRITIHLNETGEDKSGCGGRGYFGTAEELRKRLGDKVTIDLFLVDVREYFGLETETKIKENGSPRQS